MPYAVSILALTIVATALAHAVWRKRDEERAVERALANEVAALRWQAAIMATEIARRHKARKPLDREFFALWRLSPPLVYPAAGASLGRLSGDALDRVGYFHAQLADARARLAEARVAGGFEPTPYRMLSCLVRAYHHVNPWLQALQRRYGHVPTWDAPDVGEANAFLNDFEHEGAEERLAVAYCWTDCSHP